ncbi:hypothetical protein ABOM_008874 [Aspergillus bombycis]|uniref:Uncharacterized protein n=1 Tax=Aspergillus bombycis TaxID=109264 RepID=A0A1F7ZUQ0_9EURO|nr:hypothetical protein ABOM_008874 [Aspergillus bombycis]OGM43193.1 hypothetical protein ABOM_008874 [Aspergillus bombycis]
MDPILPIPVNLAQAIMCLVLVNMALTLERVITEQAPAILALRQALAAMVVMDLPQAVIVQAQAPMVPLVHHQEDQAVHSVTNGQRSRRKKGVVTIESIAPGRAPLGAWRPIPSATTPCHHVENRAITPSSSERPRSASKCDSWHSSASRLSTLTPAPQLIPFKTDAFPLQSVSRNTKPRRFSSFLPQTPLPNSRSQSSLHLITRSGPLAEKAQSLPTTLTPPLPVEDNYLTPRMAFRRSFARPHCQAFRSGNTHDPMYQDDVYELRGFDDLPSSQAICLTKFAKAHPRNKGNKSWKPLQLESTEDSDRTDSQSPMALFETGRSEPRSRLSALHRAYSGDCHLNKHSERVLAPTRFHSQSYDYSPEVQPGEAAWLTNANAIHYQENPLNYSHNYGFPYSYPHSQQHSCVSESPFLRNDDYHSSEHLPWSTDLHSISNGLSLMGVSQPNVYNQNYIADGSIMTDSSLNIYSASFDQPDSRSPYESVPVHYDALAHESLLTRHPSLSASYEDRSRDFSSISWDPSLNAAYEHVSSPKPSTPAMECQSQTPALSYFQTLNDVDAPQMPRAEAPGPDHESFDKDDKGYTQEEKLALLTGAEYERITADQDKFSVTQMEACDAHAQGTTTMDSSSDRVSDLSGEPTTTDSINSGNVDIRATYPLEMTEKSSRLGPVWYDFTERWKGIPAAGVPGYLNLMTSKRIRPPPGLSEPVVHNPTTWPLACRNDPLVTQRRLDEANEWFRKDARGQEQLRGQVTDIAQNYAERIEGRSGTTRALQESTTAKQISSLIGNVIINLHFYVSESSSRDSAGFADFEDVESCYCEPSLGGRRSYFDRDPSNHWRLRLDRAHSTMSNMSESSPSSSHIRAP